MESSQISHKGAVVCRERSGSEMTSWPRVSSWRSLLLTIKRENDFAWDPKPCCPFCFISFDKLWLVHRDKSSPASTLEDFMVH